MNKRLFSLLLLAALLFSLAACGKDEPDLLVPPDQPPAVQDPIDPPADPGEEQIFPDREPAPDPPVSQADWIIDTTLLTERSQTIELVFPADDDLLLVFTSTLSGGSVSEQISLYTYSLTDRAFTGDWVSLGIVGQYPSEIYADGTVMVLTRNTETYAYEDMIFIDPHALTMEKYSLAAIEDLRAVHISPDKTKAALSTQQGLRITDLSLETIHALYPGYIPEGGDPDLDYVLPMATGWLGSEAVVGKLLGWEWVFHPFLLTPDGTVTPLESYEWLTALPYGSDLLLFDSFTLEPLSLVSADGTLLRQLEIEHLPKDDSLAYISALSHSGSHDLLGLAIATPDGEEACRADIYHEGKLLTTLTLPQNGAFPVTFDSIDFTPDGHKAVLMTGATVDYPRSVHIVTID